MEITENRLIEILDGQRKEFQHFNGVMQEHIDTNIKFIAEQLHDVKSTLNSHTQMIGSLAEDMQIVKSDIELIKSLLRKKVDYEEFEALTKRVMLLEAKVKK